MEDGSDAEEQPIDPNPAAGATRNQRKKIKKKAKKLAEQEEERIRLEDERARQEAEREREKAEDEKRQEEERARQEVEAAKRREEERVAEHRRMMKEDDPSAYYNFYSNVQKRNKGAKWKEGVQKVVPSDLNAGGPRINDTGKGHAEQAAADQHKGGPNQQVDQTQGHLAPASNRWLAKDEVSAMAASLEKEFERQLHVQIELARKGKATVKTPAIVSDSEHCEMFEDFLTSHKKDGDAKAELYYPAYVEFMKKLKIFELEVNFLDLLYDKKYKDLAVRIGKNKQHQWLNGAVARFLYANGMASEEMSELKWKVSVRFINMESLKPLNIFLKSKPLWSITKNGERPLTEHGASSFSLLICDAVKKHKNKISYKGLVKEDDILMGDHFCWVYSKQFKDEPCSSLILDFSGIWNIMSPFYLSAKAYPQGFKVLYEVLHLVHFSPYEVDSPWFNRFVSFLPTLAPSDAKRVLLVELRRTVKETRSQQAEFLTRVPAGPWQKWRRSESASEQDKWTVRIEDSSSPVLKGVLCYDPQDTTIEQRNNQSQPGFSKGKGVQIGASTNCQPSTSQEVGRPRYANTVWGMLDYDRCVVEHGAEHVEDVIFVENEKSMEIHGSESLPDILAYLLFSMLRENLVKGWLAHVWATYKKLFRRPKED